LALTVNVKVTAPPTTEGFGTWPVIAVVVLAVFTVCGTPAELLAAKLPSPAYAAVRFFAPAVVGVNVHVPAVTVPVHVLRPSLTVTFPVGVPLAEVTV
jgi:hypothetical protein